MLQQAFAQIKAFPQAEGFGAAARGGRGGDVYHVTSLLDNGAPGTLRHGIVTAPSTGRTIVFDVGGWINLNSKLGVDTHIRNLTIAGQTAPGGIGVRGNQFSVGGDDIVIRHMRFRPGKNSGRNDSVNTNNNAERVIYDHISAGFSYDENFSVQGTDITLQYSSVAFGLEDHSAGSLLENPVRLTMHHNLYAHNNTRNPKHRVKETLDWVNNVIYNWNARAFYMEGTSDPSYQWTANVDGNYFIAGPNTGSTKPLSGGSTQNYETWLGTNAYDNDRDSVHNGTEYSFGDRTLSNFTSAATRWKNTTANPGPFSVADEVWKDASPQAAYERVLSEFGATPWARDEVDQLLYSHVINRTGNIISHENQLVAQGVSNAGFGTLGGLAPLVDTDGDGMPDVWEIKHGLDPLVPDNNGDFDNDGYTNLEEYLNDLAAFKAVGALEFDGTGRYADWNNWTRRWEPSRLDDVHINVGSAVVDAVGQKAGTLRVGADVGSSGELAVESGWIEITDDLHVGGDGTGNVAHSGGELRVLNGGVHIDNGTYLLSGGKLVTPLMTQGEDGSFEFTGGTLQADELAFDVTVNGGTITPGKVIGTTHVAGNIEFLSGTLEIDWIASRVDKLTVEGEATLGGNLVIVTPFGAPDSGNWEIISASQILGEFDNVTEGFYVQNLGDRLILHVATSSTLDGDFNGDGKVDAADYTVWRNLYGTMYDMDDYYMWKTNYGNATAQGSGGLVAIPEPATIYAALVMPLALSCGWRMVIGRSNNKFAEPGTR